MDREYSSFGALKGLVLYLVPFAIIGAILGIFWQAMSLSMAGLLIWHYYYQQKLTDWLWNSRNLMPPTAPGSWSYI